MDMIFLYILAGILALIIILLIIPVQIELRYSEELLIRIKYLFIPFQVFPKKEKAEKKDTKVGRFIKEFWIRHCSKGWTTFKVNISRTAAKIRHKSRKIFTGIKEKLGVKKKEAAPKDSDSAQVKEKSAFAQLREARGFSGMVELIWRMVSLAGGAFGRILHSITVNRFDFNVIIGGEDAADTAVSYGRWCSVLYPALAFILGKTLRYNKNINIIPDFSGSGTKVDADILLTVVPVSLLAHSAGAFLKLLFLEIKDAVKQKMDEASAQASQNIKQGGAF